MPEPLQISLTEHLDTEQLQRVLEPVTAQLADRSVLAVLIVDASNMTGYDNAARQQFVEWNSTHRDQLSAVAIVTDKVLWRVVISAMSLASRQTMKAFDTVAHARSWALESDSANP